MKRSVLSIVFVLGLAALSIGTSGAEQQMLTFESVDTSVQIPATLIKPAGEGPFPAVVIMHDCSGLGPGSSGAPLRWAQELVSQGYVALIPDSFTPRGFPDGVCTVPGDRATVANGHVRAGDAYGALAALRKLPYVDGKRVGILGGSHGGGLHSPPCMRPCWRAIRWQKPSATVSTPRLPFIKLRLALRRMVNRAAKQDFWSGRESFRYLQADCAGSHPYWREGRLGSRRGLPANGRGEP